MPTSKKNSELHEIVSYTIPKLYTGKTGKDWYIGFYAFNPAENKLKIKRIKLNNIEKIGERRKYATDLIARLYEKLRRGWNPWIEADHAKAYNLFKDVCSHYRTYITKLFSDNIYREDTYKSYLSYLLNIEKWNDNRKLKITYVYQFDRALITEFLEHIYLERNNSAQTRDNYLGFLKTFSTFLIQNMYVNTKPTDGISSLGRRLKKKRRTILSENDMIRLHDFLEENNKYFLLASYILHYCFIRPKEMAYIKLKNISLKRQTIFISDDVSKNKKDGTVTLPAKVIRLMLDLCIFENNNDNDYLFSDRFMPGSKFRDSKQFRDYWDKIRKELKFPITYKFYSLKDTGITSMLRKYDNITVRDQARHADILMTDTYTPHDIQTANALIINHEGIF